jgi:hypothetical protein
MSVSYNVLVALCICIGVSWNKKKLLPAIIAIASLLLLIVVGSRGASFSALMYILLLLIVKYMDGEKKMVLTVIFITILLTVSLGGYYISEITNLIDSGDLFSRNLSKLDNDSFFSHDDRDEIKQVIEVGLDKNFLGYGLLGDRIIFQNENFKGVYAHNILLEMRADFGIIVGPILFAVFFVKLVTSFFYLGGLKRDFLIIMIPAGFIKLWFSGSFLVSPDFYCLLALLINLKDIRRKRTLNYSNIVRNDTVI